MKKLASLCIVMIVFCTCYYSAFAGNKHKHIAAISTEGSDSTKHHPKDKKHPHPTVGGGTWAIAINVGDLTGKPISGATVTAPCTGFAAKTTNASGYVSFTGNAPCPCAEGQATISTNKGCSIKIAITCDSNYNVNCSQ